ncbi:MAG: hypothetical protein KC776_12485 [Myxococcales bacterium]|nr:hypothetical protein [Myxococcales bacterium]MCB9576777.1 hypothetical protein [Polyangiaceae bacterium]
MGLRASGIFAVLALATLLLGACTDDEAADGTGGGSGAGGAAGASSGGSGGATGGASGSGGATGGASGSGGASGGASGSSGSAGATSNDAGSDAATDAMMDGGAPVWPDVLFTGVWYVGWSGGLDHYSWMKLTETGPGQANGQWAALDAVCGSCTGYFPCEGDQGLFIASKQAPMTLTLQYPLACAGDSGAPDSEVWTIKSFGPPPSFPAGALLTASVQVGSNPTQVVNAYLYPASQCNPAFKSCTNPF